MASRLQAAAWTRADTIALIAITLVGGLLRLIRLADPDDLIFDETYYAKDSCFYLYGQSGADLCETDYEITYVHPPLAKWVIAIGIRLFGFDSFGWRFLPFIAGTITVALVYLLARKIFRSTVAACIASGLLAFDFMHFVQSRTSMLDIFVPLFGVAAVLFVVYDRDRMIRHAEEAGAEEEEGEEEQEEEPHGLLDRPWRIAAGAAAGAAVASKWSGILVLFMVVALTITWEIVSRRRDGPGRAFVRFLREEAVTILVWMAALPMVIYVAMYVGRVDGELLALPWSDGSWFRAVWNQQFEMLHFHARLSSHHTYESPPWSWILVKRPVSFAYCGDVNCDPPIAANNVKEIFTTGNPFVWWSSILAFGYMGYRWFVDRDWRGPEGVILAGILFTYGTWLALGVFSARAAVFIFYLLPAVPFICLAIAYIATKIGESWEARAAIGLFIVGTLGTFVFYYPLLANVAIPQPSWQSRIWIFDNCDKPPVEQVTSLSTLTTNGEEVVSTNITSTDESIPPSGWCWI